jgi:HTH-type transcriptional regulator/antitoxin HigA
MPINKIIMATLKYKVIKSKTQYAAYTRMLEELVFADVRTKDVQDEIDLLTLLVEKWDAENAVLKAADPVRLLHSLMADHKMKSKDLADLLKVSKGYVSDILHYKKGLSKDSIRILSAYFKVSQEAFNRPYHWFQPLPPFRPAKINLKTKRRNGRNGLGIEIKSIWPFYIYIGIHKEARLQRQTVQGALIFLSSFITVFTIIITSFYRTAERKNNLNPDCS